jgi:hypothetical protein
MTVIRDVAEHSLEEVVRRFRDAYCLHHQSEIKPILAGVRT